MDSKPFAFPPTKATLPSFVPECRGECAPTLWAQGKVEIANRVSLPEVLDDLCRTIDAHVPGVISTVLLMDSDGKRLWLGAGPRFPAALKSVAFPWPVGLGKGSCGTAAFLK